MLLKYAWETTCHWLIHRKFDTVFNKDRDTIILRYGIQRQFKSTCLNPNSSS